jgi:hypothetical protein
MTRRLLIGLGIMFVVILPVFGLAFRPDWIHAADWLKEVAFLWGAPMLFVTLVHTLAARPVWARSPGEWIALSTSVGGVVGIASGVIAGTIFFGGSGVLLGGLVLGSAYGLLVGVATRGAAGAGGAPQNGATPGVSGQG